MKLRTLPPAARAVVRDLITDARCARRDARQFPDTATDILPYADLCELKARAIRAGQPYTFNDYGWPVLLYPTHGHPDAPA
jgi:hypothetical protein